MSCARLLGSLCRTGRKSVSYLRVLATSDSKTAEARALAALDRIAEDEVEGCGATEVVRSDSIVTEITHRAYHNDLVILGLQRAPGHRRLRGATTIQIASAANCPLIMISRR